MSKIFLITLLLILPFCIYTQTAEELTTAKAEREKDVNDKQKAFSKTKFETAVAGCFSAYQIALDGSSISDSDKNTLAQAANNYYACTYGGDDRASENLKIIKAVDSESDTANASNIKQTGFCKYYDDIDGSDYLKVYYAAQQCYALGTTSTGTSPNIVNNVVSGFALEEDLFEDCEKITYTSDSSSPFNSDEAVAFSECLEDALFYLLPYTERQFKLCEQTCVSNHSDAPIKVVSNEFTFTVPQDLTGFQNCQKYSQACARFDITVGGDQTNTNYAKYFEACFEKENEGCWFDTWDNNGDNTFDWSDQTNINAFFNCVKECERPDYSYNSDASSNYLQPLLIVLFIVFISLV